MPTVVRLRELREAKGLSREALSRLADISSATVEAIEMRGVDPKLSTALKLAEALGCTVQDLYGEAA